MKRRLSIAISLVGNPKVVMLDGIFLTKFLEPTTGIFLTKFLGINKI
jgi:ABC-type multidrug transport system ATPase subunit